MIKILSVEEILKAPDVEEKTVPVPEWGGAVKIRTLTKATQQELRKQSVVGGEYRDDRFEILLFIHGVVEPKFGEAHFGALQGKSAKAMDRVLKVIMEASGLTEEVAQAAEKSFRPGVSGS